MQRRSTTHVPAILLYIRRRMTMSSDDQSGVSEWVRGLLSHVETIDDEWQTVRIACDESAWNLLVEVRHRTERRYDDRSLLRKFYLVRSEYEAELAAWKHLSTQSSVTGYVPEFVAECSSTTSQAAGDVYSLVMTRVGTHELFDYVRGMVGTKHSPRTIAYNVCKALHAVSGACVVHGDLHEGNLMIDAESGHVHVIDFGSSMRVPDARVAFVSMMSDRKLLEASIAWDVGARHRWVGVLGGVARAFVAAWPNLPSEEAVKESELV